LLSFVLEVVNRSEKVFWTIPDVSHLTSALLTPSRDIFPLTFICINRIGPIFGHFGSTLIFYFLDISNARGKTLLGNEWRVIWLNNPPQTFGVTSLILNLHDCINRYVFKKTPNFWSKSPHYGDPQKSRIWSIFFLSP